jgi:hypothetical protein
MSEQQDYGIVSLDIDNSDTDGSDAVADVSEPETQIETSTYEQTSTSSTTSYVDGKYFLYLFVGIVLMVISGFALYYIVNHRDEIIAAASASTSVSTSASTSAPSKIN